LRALDLPLFTAPSVIKGWKVGKESEHHSGHGARHLQRASLVPANAGRGARTECGDGALQGRCGYTGEVNAVSIEENTLTSRAFLQAVSDFITNSDFTPWARSDEDSVFVYPARFGS
jgi:hypothetical protein